MDSALNINHYIVRDGVRVGFFDNEKTAREAMAHCQSGFMISKEAWEKQNG